MHRWRKTKAGESRFLDGLNFICCIMLEQHDARTYRHGTCHALATANALLHGAGIGMVDKALAAMRLIHRKWQSERLRQASLNAVERQCWTIKGDPQHVDVKKKVAGPAGAALQDGARAVMRHR
jgi:hypothetical protein